MSREDERGRSGSPQGAAGNARESSPQNPFLEGAERPRKKRPKGSPQMISAGGVDMARAHASGIKLPDESRRLSNSPKVVVSVETDPRRVPTQRKLLEGRESGGRSALLPGDSSAAAVTAPTTPSGRPAPMPSTAPPSAAERRRGGVFRIAAAAVFLLLLAGVVKRVWLRPAAPVNRPIAAASVAPPPVLVTADPTPSGLPEEAATTALPAAPPADPVSPVESATAPPVIPAGVTATAAPRPRQPKPLYKPPFELPAERSKN